MREAQQVRIRAQVQDLGRVQQVGDGVARVEGLSEAMLDEVVLFSNGIKGQIFDYLYRTGVPSTRPTGDDTPRVIPHHPTSVLPFRVSRDCVKETGMDSRDKR